MQCFELSDGKGDCIISLNKKEVALLTEIAEVAYLVNKKKNQLQKII